MKYHKLVRDKIPQIIRQKGGQPVTHIAGDAEYWEKLKEKLLEETREFNENSTTEELADIYEVIDAICGYKNFNHDEILKIQRKKSGGKGGFKKKIILDEA